MVKALSFTAASVFCLLSLVLNIERVLTLVRRPPPYSGDYGDYSGSRDYERDLQSMVRHVEPLMAILRNRQRDTEPSFNRMHEGISSNNIRNYDQHPASTNNLLSRLDQLANPMLNTQAALPFNRLGPGMSPGGGLANALAMLNPNAIKRYGGGGYGGGGYGGGYNGAYGGGGTCGVGSLCYGQNGQNGQTGQFSTLGLVSIIATALLYLLFFYYISTSTTTTTTATGRRRKRAYQDEARQDLDYDFDFIDQQQDIVMLDGPTWLSMVHELWEQDDSPENVACIQETLCRMNRLALSAPGQAGWAVSLSSLPLSYLLHARHTGGFTSYIDAALMGRSGANCTELYSSCPRLRY